MPETGEKIRAVKCNPIMTHAVSQILDAGVLLLRATEAKAQANSATAPTSGNLLQSTTTAPLERNGTNRIDDLRAVTITLLRHFETIVRTLVPFSAG